MKVLFAKDSKEQKSGKRQHKKPLSPGHGHKLKRDKMEECRPESTSRYQQIIVIQEWVIELGRINILPEFPILLQYQVTPRKGHLEEIYLIVH